MVKVRIELVPDFGPQKGQVLSGVVVDANYESVFKAVQNKLQLKKKEASVLTLCQQDFAGVRALPRGDLSEIVCNGAVIVVCKSTEASVQTDAASSKMRFSKKAQQAATQLRLVEASAGSLSARGRPNPETLAALQHHKGVTGVVTLLRQDEFFAGNFKQACERLGLKWLHAPLAGPKVMGMIGDSKVNLSQEDLDSFKQVHQAKEWLKLGEKLIVHCAAGLHRTGIFLYVLLRELGETPECALERIKEMRQETFDEFIRLGFHCKAEALFSLVGTDPSGTVGSDVQVVAARVATIESEPEEGEEDEEEGQM